MKIFNKDINLAIQGDIAICNIGSLPPNVTAVKPENNIYILAHSETGHHHVVPATNTQVFADLDNELISYLVVEEDDIKLTHNRTYDTHETISFDVGVYRINRQREYTPEGYRRVAD